MVNVKLIDLGPNFDDVTVLHVEVCRSLPVRHFAAIKVEAHLTLGGGGHLGHVLGEDGAQRSILKNTHIIIIIVIIINIIIFVGKLINTYTYSYFPYQQLKPY